MAGMNVGTSNLGSFRGAPEISSPMPKPAQSQRRGRHHGFDRRNESPVIDSAPSKPPPRWSKLGGMLSNQDILPSTMDPYRKYGSVSGGRMTPPSNPYEQNQPIRFTPGGEYGGGQPPMSGDIDSGPSQNPWLSRGGFTGGQMPPNMGGGGEGIGYFPPPPPGQPWIGGGPEYMNPQQSNVPNMGQAGMGGGMIGGLRGAYGRQRF